MRNSCNVAVLFAAVLAASCTAQHTSSQPDDGIVDNPTTLSNHHNFPNDEGFARTFNPQGFTRLDSIFFEDLGTNRRECGSCHDPANGWTVSAAGVQARFAATDGNDPIFRLVDGSNSPNADVSTVDLRKAAYSMLLSRGVIRVGRPIPAGAEFTLDNVDDPYGFASASELSLFRRPLPTANLEFITVVMWDGRETARADDIDFDLGQQSNDATVGHAQAAKPLTAEQRHSMVDFETPVFAAQYISNDAGNLTDDGAYGGPQVLALDVPFYPGIEAPGYTFDLYDAWAYADYGPQAQVRQSIARGQEIFNNRQFAITGAAGLSDQTGTCATCHNVPDVGGNSNGLLVNTGISDGARRTPDMPLYTLRNIATNAVITTTDPGLALSTGKWADIGRFKVPNLRAIETRSPYFHSGFVDTIEKLVDFYDTRFSIGLTDAEKADLAAFIKVL